MNTIHFRDQMVTYFREFRLPLWCSIPDRIRIHQSHTADGCISTSC